MTRYRFCFQIDGKVFDELEHDCGDDLDALTMAQNLSQASDVVVWKDGQFIAHVKEGNAPSTVHDAQAG